MEIHSIPRAYVDQTLALSVINIVHTTLQTKAAAELAIPNKVLCTMVDYYYSKPEKDTTQPMNVAGAALVRVCVSIYPSIHPSFIEAAGVSLFRLSLKEMGDTPTEVNV